MAHVQQVARQVPADRHPAGAARHPADRGRASTSTPTASCTSRRRTSAPARSRRSRSRPAPACPTTRSSRWSSDAESHADEDRTAARAGRGAQQRPRTPPTRPRSSWGSSATRSTPSSKEEIEAAIKDVREALESEDAGRDQRQDRGAPAGLPQGLRGRCTQQPRSSRPQSADGDAASGDGAGVDGRRGGRRRRRGRGRGQVDDDARARDPAERGSESAADADVRHGAETGSTACTRPPTPRRRRRRSSTTSTSCSPSRRARRVPRRSRSARRPSSRTTASAWRATSARRSARRRASLRASCCRCSTTSSGRSRRPSRRRHGASTRRRACELVHDELLAALARAGDRELRRPTGEPFDPTWHEAIVQHAGRGRRAGTVVEVSRRATAQRRQVLRPARVVVAA